MSSSRQRLQSMFAIPPVAGFVEKVTQWITHSQLAIKIASRQSIRQSRYVYHSLIFDERRKSLVAIMIIMDSLYSAKISYKLSNALNQEGLVQKKSGVGIKRIVLVNSIGEILTDDISL